VLIKEYGRSWPPSVTTGEQIPPIADMEDIVLSVERCSNPQNVLKLRLCNTKYGTEYTVALAVPAPLQETILLSIVRKENITLREVGELPITETVFVEPVTTASQSSSLTAPPAKQTRRMRLFGVLRLLWLPFGLFDWPFAHGDHLSP
jgi:hypothetical protein